MIILIFLFASLTFAAAVVLIKYFRLLKFSWNLGGPKAIPIFGNGLLLANKTSLGAKVKIIL